MKSKEQKLEELMSCHYLTIHGNLTITELIERYGKPKTIFKYAKVEAKTGLTSKATIVVERFVDGELYFDDKVVIPGIPKNLLDSVENSGTEIAYVRHPSYKIPSIIKATDNEILKNLG